jgi:hypothetical protein
MRHSIKGLEYKNKMELIRKNPGYRLLIKDNATRKQYETIVNYIIEKLQLQENQIQDIDDFDSYYLLFNYNGNRIVLSYSNFFGISIYFSEEDVKANVQEKVLKELSEILSEVQL